MSKASLVVTTTSAEPTGPITPSEAFSMAKNAIQFAQTVVPPGQRGMSLAVALGTMRSAEGFESASFGAISVDDVMETVQQVLGGDARRDVQESLAKRVRDRMISE